MKRFFTFTLLLFMVVMVKAQMLNPVKFTSTLKTNGSADAEIVFTGKISQGWHVYSTGLGGDGPISATFNVNKLDGVKLVGKLQPRGHEISTYDKLFDMKLRYLKEALPLCRRLSSPSPTTRLMLIWSMAPATTRTVCRLLR